ncbi:alpha/beta-hydrolase [Backusella circina FSU 941]|nr:alpha/beta-hydrolase [Backusella circina FSU 941]
MFSAAVSLPEPGRVKSWPYLGYMLNAYKNLFLTFYFNWPMIFTSPISSAAFLTVYPTTVVFLLVFEFGLKLFMEKWGGAKLVKFISIKYGHGFGAINWGSPNLLLSDTSFHLFQSTLPSLGFPATPIPLSHCRQRTFDLSIAQICVLLSSVIYERDANKVKQAYRLYADAMHDEGISKEQEMKALLWESEAKIRAISEHWGLHFAGVSELKSLGGPFCGIFWSETTPFIIVSFKGTTPTNYEEFLVDATFQRTDARSFLFGCVHEGFYESLFSTSGFGDQDIRDPYSTILDSLISKATQIQQKLHTDQPVQLWVTGHSLGASLSSLLFARLLKCPEDLQGRLVLRDAYVIGTPAIGDSDFASTFSSFTNMPVTRHSTLWRIINQSDIFCRLPPGYDSKTCGHYLSESDFFNYSHIGHAIQITHNWETQPLKSYPSSYQPPLQVNITTSGSNHKGKAPAPLKLDQEELPVLPAWAHRFILNRPWFTKRNPIYVIEKLYPFFLMDHIPSQYFYGLQRARVYYEEGMKQPISEK